jgi:hypothetical protein
MGLFAAGNKLLAADLNALPQIVDSNATSATSPVSSGTTEQFDTNLGNVTIVADGSTQYDIEMTNATLAPTVAGDHFLIRIRDGGAAIPTTATPGATVANCPYRCQVASGPGQEGRIVRNRFTPTAGTHIFGVSYTRDSGTGVIQLAGDRQLIVRTAGPA